MISKKLFMSKNVCSILDFTADQIERMLIQTAWNFWSRKGLDQLQAASVVAEVTLKKWFSCLTTLSSDEEKFLKLEDFVVVTDPFQQQKLLVELLNNFSISQHPAPWIVTYGHNLIMDGNLKTIFEIPKCCKKPQLLVLESIIKLKNIFETVIVSGSKRPVLEEAVLY